MAHRRPSHVIGAVGGSFQNSWYFKISAEITHGKSQEEMKRKASTSSRPENLNGEISTTEKENGCNIKQI
jgi:hypothetical protein